MIDKAQEVKKKQEDAERTIGWVAKRRKRIQLRREVNDIKKEFVEFEEVVECFKQEQKMHEVNPLVHLSYLMVGCVGFIGSFLIIFHT